jgi:Cu/Ag efflux protein CusF
VTRAPAAAAAAGLAVACGLWPLPALPHAQPTTTVQFDREIVRILDNHCVMCHVERGSAFPLVTYEQAYATRWKIRQDALDRHMAPWAAVAGYGDFINGNGLTQREIDFLVSWAESFGPRNNGEVYTGVATGAPRVIQAHSDFGRWELGKPDLLLAVPAHPVKPQQPGVIGRTIDPGLTSTRWLRGLEYKPGDRRAVHAARFTIQETGEWLGSWTPWYGFVSLPRGLAHRLPARSHIVAEIHYYGAREPLVEQGSLGLYFAAGSSRPLVNLTVDAKAAAPATAKWVGKTTLESDTHVLALQPKLQPGVQSIEVAAQMPDGTTQVLLFARDIPLQWPTPYIFGRPVALRKGTQLSVIEHFAGDAAAGSASGAAVTFSAYQGEALAEDQPQAHPAPAAAVRHFKLSGTVKSVDTADARVVIQHEAIPGFMGAMTMSYGVPKPEDLRGVAAGDQIQSDVVVSDTGTWLENIKVLRRPSK